MHDDSGILSPRFRWRTQIGRAAEIRNPVCSNHPGSTETQRERKHALGDRMFLSAQIRLFFDSQAWHRRCIPPCRKAALFVPLERIRFSVQLAECRGWRAVVAGHPKGFWKASKVSGLIRALVRQGNDLKLLLATLFGDCGTKNRLPSRSVSQGGNL